MLLRDLNDITERVVIPLLIDRDISVIKKYFSPAVEVRTTFFSGIGHEFLRLNYEETFKNFPDLKVELINQIQFENKIIYKWSSSIHHGEHVLTFSGMTFGELEDGLIISYHSFSDIPQAFGMDVLGALPSLNAHTKDEVISEIRRLLDVKLSVREIETLSLWLKGCSMKLSARKMGDLSYKTIQTFRENIKSKLDVSDYQHLVDLLRQKGVEGLLFHKALEI